MQANTTARWMMMKLTKEQRDNRDQLSADLAIRRAEEKGLRVAVAVDNPDKAKAMVKRLRDILESRDLDYAIIHKEANITELWVGEGVIIVIPMEKK